MLGETLRLISVAEPFQANQVIAVKGLHRSDGQADAMNRNRVVLAQARELMMGQTPCAHVVFGMHLEKSDRLRADNDVRKMLGLEAHTSTRRQLRYLHCPRSS